VPSFRSGCILVRLREWERYFQHPLLLQRGKWTAYFNLLLYGCECQMTIKYWHCVMSKQDGRVIGLNALTSCKTSMSQVWHCLWQWKCMTKSCCDLFEDDSHIIFVHYSCIDGAVHELRIDWNKSPRRRRSAIPFPGMYIFTNKFVFPIDHRD